MGDTGSPAVAGEAKLSELIAAWEGIGPNARRLLVAVAGRLVKGASEHGDFDPTQPRNWLAETADELLDAVVYLTVQAQRGVR